MEYLATIKNNCTRELLVARFKAFAIHFSLSLIIFLIISYFLIFHWFPAPFFFSEGGWQGMKIMIGVDLVLGPLLTLLIYNPLKRRKEIIIDLSVIVIIQLSALAWGLSNVYSQRIMAISYWESSFYAVYPHALTEQGLGDQHFLQVSQETPPVVYTRQPFRGESDELVTWNSEKGLPIWSIGFLHRPFESGYAVINGLRLMPEEIYRQQPSAKAEVEKVAEQHNLSVDEVIIVPFRGKYQTEWLLLSQRGKVLTSIAIND